MEIKENDSIIDYDYLYYSIADRLFKYKFPPSKDPFNFEEKYKDLDFTYLKDSFSFYILENSNIPLHQQIRTFLMEQGYIEDNTSSRNDTKLTDKGIETVEKGGIDQYRTYRQRQEYLFLKTQESVLKTNRISTVTTIITTIAVLAGTIMSYWSFQLSRESNSIQKDNLKSQKELKTWDSLHHIIDQHKYDTINRK